METTSFSRLSDEQIASFHDRGVLKVDFDFDMQFLDRLLEHVYPHYDQDFRQHKVPFTRIQDAWKIVDEVRQLAVSKKIATALEQLLGRKALPFQTLNFPVGTTQSPHSDTIHFNTIPTGYMVGVWIALEDIDLENGPLIYYPGSHKMPEYVMQDFDLEPGENNYPQYEQAIRNLIEKNKLVPEYGIAKKGEAIIWHANLLHGGAPLIDSSRSRHSQVIHFFFEGCEYYTPMISKGEELSYRQPHWIPENTDFVLPENESIAKRAYRWLRNRFRKRNQGNHV